VPKPQRCIRFVGIFLKNYDSNLISSFDTSTKIFTPQSNITTCAFFKIHIYICDNIIKKIENFSILVMLELYIPFIEHASPYIGL